MKRKPKKSNKDKPKPNKKVQASPGESLTMPQTLFWLVAWVPYSGVQAYFVGGFVGGFILAEAGYSILGNTVGRVFVGCIMCILSATSGGFPPEDFGPAKPINFWPYILGSWAVIFVAPFVHGISHSRRQTRNPNEAVKAAMNETALWVRSQIRSQKSEV